MSFADPLWEFVLDDYDDENASLFSKFSRKKKKKKKYKNDEKSVGSRSFLSKKKETRAEYRDDIPEEQDGFWDVISGKPPAAARMRRSRSFDGRTSSRGRDNMMSKNNKTRSSSLTRSQSSVSEADTNEKKKRMFSKKRFSWNQNQKSSDNSSLKEYAAPNARNVKHASLADDRYGSKTPSHDGTFDPMDLLFQIADKIDPWAYDSDASFSDDESYTDDEGDRYSHVTSNVGSDTNLSDTQRSRSQSRSSRNPKTQKLNSLLDPPKESKKEENSMTEIRLRVNPVGNTLSEEVFEKKTNAFGEQEGDLRKVPSDEERYNMFATSFDSDSFQKTLQIMGESTPPMDFETREMRENREMFMNERRMSEKEERRAPTNGRRTDLRTKPSIRDDMSKDSASAKSSGLKKAMCGRKKVDDEDTTASRSKKTDPSEAFPASRMVIDGESHLIAESDTASAIIGPMAVSKGPQPVFAYDYESNMNMDVIYVKPNHKPRTSISVRKLGTPPPISSVLGADHIVIQVEVRQRSILPLHGLLKNSRPSTTSTSFLTFCFLFYFFSGIASI